MLVGDNRGHEFLQEICDMIWHLPNSHGDVWIFDKDKKEPALKYEIKTLSDYWNRLTSESLNMQLENVDGLILMGEEDFGWDFVRLHTSLNGIEDHTRVYRVRDKEHLRQFLRLREKKIAEGTYGLIEKRRKVVKEYPDMVHALTTIEKVSYTIAQRIYETFDSLEDMVVEARKIKNGRLDIKDSRFCQIDKVGPVLAQKVVDWCDQPWPSKQKKLMP